MTEPEVTVESWGRRSKIEYRRCRNPNKLDSTILVWVGQFNHDVMLKIFGSYGSVEDLLVIYD